VRELATQHVGDQAMVEITGLIALTVQVFVSVISSLKISYAIALVTVGVLLLFMVGDLRIGFVSLIPNLVPIAVALGVMGWFGIPIGVYTLLVGSIALGLAVDDTIHVAHSFVHFERESGNPREALTRTLSTAGTAVLFTSAALICGFLAYSFATLSTLMDFGVVCAVAVAAALVADLFVSPVLFLWVRERERPGSPKHVPRPQAEVFPPSEQPAL